MSQSIRHDIPSLPVADYQPAIAQAVRWLGDRYLLAEPVKARRRPGGLTARPAGAGVLASPRRER